MIEVLKRLGYYPRFCVWELTLACNLRCLHCGSYAGERRKDELSWEEAQDVADQLAAMRCEKVTLGGGEPTLHPRWHEIGKRLTDQGVRVNIISNGWHWTEEHVRKSRNSRRLPRLRRLIVVMRLVGIPASTETLIAEITRS